MRVDARTSHLQSGMRALRAGYRAIRWNLGAHNSRRLLMIACVPKSGSTYLRRVLSQVTGYPRVFPVQRLGPNEQDLSAGKLRRLRYSDGVCHVHTKATLFNLQLLKSHRIKPVVLVRDLFDVVVSLDDHLRNESRHVTTGYAPRSYLEGSPEQRWEFLIRVHLPWYFSFLLSWQEAQEELSIRWLSYDELFADQVEIVRDLLGYWELDYSEEEIQSAITALQGKETRLNRGVSGRGRELPERLQTMIRESADVCDLDASVRKRVGLGPEPTNTDSVDNSTASGGSSG